MVKCKLQPPTFSLTGPATVGLAHPGTVAPGWLANPIFQPFHENPDGTKGDTEASVLFTRIALAKYHTLSGLNSKFSLPALEAGSEFKMSVGWVPSEAVRGDLIQVSPSCWWLAGHCWCFLACGSITLISASSSQGVLPLCVCLCPCSDIPFYKDSSHNGLRTQPTPA